MTSQKTVTLAPITKKPGLVATGKSGSTNPFGKKDSFGKSGKTIGKNSSSGSKSSNTVNFGGKSSSPLISSTSGTLAIGDKKNNALNLGKPSGLLSASSSGKNYAPASFVTPNRSGKSNTSFGIIWIPTKRNKKKDIIYNPHKNYNDHKDRQPSMYNFMSGDSQSHINKHKDDEDPLVPDRKAGLGPATVATASAAVSTSDLPRESSEAVKPEEKQEFLDHSKEEDKEAGGDSHNHDKDDNEYLENKSGMDDKYPESNWEKDKMGDKVDSVYLRPPPPHKVRSTTSTAEEEDCGIKCLYYTLQCCDCVLM